MRRHSACHVHRFFRGERVWQKGFSRVLLTGIVMSHMKKTLLGHIVLSNIGSHQLLWWNLKRRNSVYWLQLCMHIYYVFVVFFSLTKQSIQLNRNVMFWLCKMMLMKLKNLREHNLQRKTEHGDSAEYVYVTDHLPIELQKQKKRLLPVFKAARKDGKKATWKIENSSCNLYIDNVRYCESP